MSKPGTEKPTGAHLAGWLASLVRSHNTGAQAALRRPDPPIRTEAHLKAASFAPAEEDEPYYQLTASSSPGTTQEPQLPGSGSETWEQRCAG
ncbi:hypothetical protein ACWDMY_23255 [Streptomyces globisporus]